jgi:hypothetical protein
MKSLLFIYTKNNLTLFLTCIVLVVLNIANIASFDMVAYILMAMMVFDINVNDKTKGNWNYLESLPISLNQRFFLKVIIPFVFMTLISIGVEDKLDIYFLIDSGFTKILISVTTLILASLLSDKLNKFLLYIIGLTILSQFLSFLPNPKLIVSFLYLIISYYIISNKRIAKNKLAVLSIIVLLPVFLTIYFGQTPIYRSLLASQKKEVSLFAANKLMSKRKDQQAIDYLVATLTNPKTTDFEFSEAMDILDDAEYKLSFSRKQWLNLFEKHTNSRSEIIHYFGQDHLRPEWVTHENLLEFEELSLIAHDCDNKCRQLSKLIYKKLKVVNSKRIKELLADDRIVKNQYALRIVKGLESNEYKDEIVELLGHPDEDIHEMSLDYLSELTKDDIKDEIKGLKKALKENSSEKNIKNIKDFFRKKL